MIRLNYSDVLGYALAGIAERGEDYVYSRHEEDETTTCLYVHDGKPDCFVGYILDKAGVRLTPEFNSLGPVRSALEKLAEMGILVADQGATETLAILQFEQDSGETWGHALEFARENAKFNKFE